MKVADPERINIGMTRCDGGGKFEGRFLALEGSYGIQGEINAPYVPQGSAIAERGFGTVISVAHSQPLGAPHLPNQLQSKAAKTTIYTIDCTPTAVLDGKAPSMDVKISLQEI